MNLPDIVARRFSGSHKLARLTQQTKLLQTVLDAVYEPLQEASALISSFYPRKTTEEGKDKIARDLAQASQVALKGLKITFENPKRQEAAKTYLTRVKNLAKMIETWQHASTWADLEPILRKLATKQKTVSQKYREYADEAVGLMSYFDTEHEDSLSIGPWSVVLFTARDGEWDTTTVGKLQYILREVSKVLARVGAGSSAGGEVYAYPTKQLPGSSASPGALASYNIPTGRISVAVKGDPQDALLHLTHEIGHKVYFKTLSANARDEWKAFFASESGPPDIDHLLAAWEQYCTKPSFEASKYGKYTSYFAMELRKTDPDMLMWLNLIASKLPNVEEFDKITGAPKKGTKPGLEVFREHKDTIKVFLHPVTAYSGKDAEECFAEVFSLYAVDGAGRIPAIVRNIFQRVLPQAKTASDLIP